MFEIYTMLNYLTALMHMIINVIHGTFLNSTVI